jgi:hypothetical protein
MVGKSVLTVKVKVSLLRTALPKLLGDGNRKVRVKGFTIRGMRQRQHFCKHTKKDRQNKPLDKRHQGLLALGGVHPSPTAHLIPTFIVLSIHCGVLLGTLSFKYSVEFYRVIYVNAIVQGNEGFEVSEI